jgi:REP element-mobilizing transposase RayT
VEIRLSSHGAYHHEFHVVWIPKYRKKILQGPLKDFVAERIYEVQEYHPDVEIERFSIQADHVHHTSEVFSVRDSGKDKGKYQQRSEKTFCMGEEDVLEE